MARQLDDPILRDCSRVVFRSPDVAAAFKTRLMDGLDAVDRELVELRELVASRKPAETDAKGKKR